MGLLRHVVMFFLLLGATAAVSVLVGMLWRRVLRRLAERTPTRLDLMILDHTEKPVMWVLLAGGVYLSFQFLVLSPDLSGNKVLGGIVKMVSPACFGVTVLAIASFAYGVVRALSTWYMQSVALRTDTALDDQVVSMFQRLMRVVIFAVATMMILRHAGVDISALLATAGVASLAVAFAAQDSLGNLFAGISIMLDRPFCKGDRVQLADGRLGDVVEIGLRSTKILTFDHTQIVIPNSQIAGASIINYSYPNPRFKIRQTVGVAYGSDVKRVKEVLLEICREHPKVLDEPSPCVYFTEFADSSLNFLLVYWIGDYRDMLEVKDAINTRINDRFEEEGIVIPFPQRDVHLYNHA